MKLTYLTMKFVFLIAHLFDPCRGEEKAGPDAALEFLGQYCKWAVVTLSSNGCIAKHGKEVSTFYVYAHAF